MSRYISEAKKQIIIERADSVCEYCRFPEYFSFWTFQVDHIISLKHGGSSELENLAWACFPCNNAKGSDVGTILLPDHDFVRFFNPRIDKWEDHFYIVNGITHSSSLIGQGTIKILNLNTPDRILERKVLKLNGY